MEKILKNKNGATFPAILLTITDPRQHPNLKLHSLLLVFDADPNRYREDLAFPVETNSGMPLLSFPTQIQLDSGFFRSKKIASSFNQIFENPISVDNGLGFPYKNITYNKFSDYMPPFSVFLYKYSCFVPSLFVQEKYNLTFLGRDSLTPQFDVKDGSFRIKTNLIEVWGHPPRTFGILKSRKKDLKRITKLFRDQMHKTKEKFKKMEKV